MRISKKRLFSYSILSIIFLPIIILIIFVYVNDAPIIHGNLEYNLDYKKGKNLDVYYPTNIVYDKSPVVLFIHGGAWITGRKESVNSNRFNGAFNTLRENGYTIISPEYTLARKGSSPFPFCIIDGFDAINWISTHSDSLNLDINNFGIMGESAGGQIAMMNIFTNPEKFDLPYKNVTFDYFVDIYGPNNLMNLYKSQLVDTLQAVVQKMPKPFQNNLNFPRILFGFDPEQDSIKTKDFTKLYSPINYINKSNVIPTLIIHGTKDQIVPFKQSEVLKEKLDSLNVYNEFYILDGINHGFIGASHEQKNSIQKWISSFILKQYNETK